LGWPIEDRSDGDCAAKKIVIGHIGKAGTGVDISKFARGSFEKDGQGRALTDTPARRVMA
jgi:hypothetical protein